MSIEVKVKNRGCMPFQTNVQEIPNLLMSGKLKVDAEVHQNDRWMPVADYAPKAVQAVKKAMPVTIPEQGIQVMADIDARPSGPHTRADVAAMLRRWHINGKSLLWWDGLEEWTELSAVADELRAVQVTLGEPMANHADHWVMLVGAVMVLASLFFGGDKILLQQTLMHVGAMGIGAGFVGRQIRVFAGRKEPD